MFPTGQSTSCLWSGQLAEEGGAENLIAITCTGGSSKSSMAWSTVVTPMMFQDGEEVREVPDPTKISHLHGEVSGCLCCTGTSPDRMGQAHPEKLSVSISSQGWQRRAWLRVLATLRSKGGTKLCKSARRVLTVEDNSRCRVWADVEHLIHGLRHIISTKITCSHQVLLLLWGQSIMRLELPALTITPDVPLTPVRKAAAQPGIGNLNTVVVHGPRELPSYGKTTAVVLSFPGMH